MVGMLDSAGAGRCPTLRAGGPRCARSSEAVILKPKHLVRKWCLGFGITASLSRRP